MKWFVSRQQDIDRDFEPGSFGSLARMIESGQFGRLERSFDSRIGDKRHQPDALDTARVFARQTVERILDLFQRALRKRALILILNAYGHGEPL